MGCYDSVIIPCPACGTEQEVQTKGGECLLRTFKLKDAPTDVLWDINRHAPFVCDACKKKFVVSFNWASKLALSYEYLLKGHTRQLSTGQKMAPDTVLPKLPNVTCLQCRQWMPRDSRPGWGDCRLEDMHEAPGIEIAIVVKPTDCTPPHGHVRVLTRSDFGCLDFSPKMPETIEIQRDHHE